MARKRKVFSVDLKTYCRISIINWREESINYYNGKCVVTGEDFDAVHHLQPLHKIIEETLQCLCLEFKNTISEYSESELIDIREKCRELHYKYGYGVCLTNKIHNEFHSLFGFDASSEDFYLYKFYKENNLDLSEIARYDISKVANLNKNIKINKAEMQSILLPMTNETDRRILFGMLIYSKMYSLRDKTFFMTMKDMSMFCGKLRKAINNRLHLLEKYKLIEIYRNKEIYMLDSDSSSFKNIPNRYKLNLLEKVNDDILIEIDKDNIFEEELYNIVITTLFSKLELKKLCTRRQYEKIPKYLLN